MSPNQHVRTLVELLRSTGPDLARRWIAALLLVPERERLALVEAVEGRISDLYLDQSAPAAVTGQEANAARPPQPPGPPDQRDREFVVMYPAQQRGGHTEQVERTYQVVEPKTKRPAARKRKRA